MAIGDYIRSTPFRIATAYACLFAFSAIILFAVIYWLVTDELESDLRGAIEQDIGNLLQVYRERGAAELNAAVAERIANARAYEAVYLLRDGNENIASPGAPGSGLGDGWIETVWIAPSDSAERDSGPNPFLVRGIRLNGMFLVVGRSLHDLGEVQAVLLHSFAWALGLTAFMGLVGGIGLGHSAVRRIDKINTAFRDIQQGNLSRRVPSRGTRDELDRLALNINETLDRIEQLMANLQQVTNDIAHDLRTPLSRLRQGLEMSRMSELTVEEYRSVVEHAIEQTDNILDIFAALLRIAQIESKARRAGFAKMDLSEIAHTIVEAYEDAIRCRGQVLVVDIAEGIYVLGDKDLLMQMLANLVENSTVHCPSGATISLALSNESGTIVTLTDNGPGIPPDARDLVLRRFSRLDASRSTSGSGLGLALVKAVADLHGAGLILSDAGPGLRIEVRFPDEAACR